MTKCLCSQFQKFTFYANFIISVSFITGNKFQPGNGEKFEILQRSIFADNELLWYNVFEYLTTKCPCLQHISVITVNT